MQQMWRVVVQDASNEEGHASPDHEPRSQGGYTLPTKLLEHERRKKHQTASANPRPHGDIAQICCIRGWGGVEQVQMVLPSHLDQIGADPLSHCLQQRVQQTIVIPNKVTRTIQQTMMLALQNTHY
jgi:hypothetical protein